MIADIPENLPVPGISTVVPSWNVRSEKYVEHTFEFAHYFLHDDGALVLIHCDDRALMQDVDECADQYDMQLLKDWWGINEHPLAHPRQPLKPVPSIPIRSFDSIL
jgi:hypothetical protein